MKRILVAGIGNAWLSDDGFGGEVARRLGERELPEGAVVLDFGTGGLDLAYEVMRGYDALVLVDVSRQGGEPGTLYVMEALEEEVDAGIEDGHREATLEAAQQLTAALGRDYHGEELHEVLAKVPVTT